MTSETIYSPVVEVRYLKMELVTSHFPGHFLDEDTELFKYAKLIPI